MADAVVPAAVPVAPAAGAAAQPQNKEEKPSGLQLVMKVRVADARRSASYAH